MLSTALWLLGSVGRARGTRRTPAYALDLSRQLTADEGAADLFPHEAAKDMGMPGAAIAFLRQSLEDAEKAVQANFAEVTNVHAAVGHHDASAPKLCDGDDPVGCRSSCSCPSFQECYVLKKGGSDVGVCGPSVVVLCFMSLTSIGISFCAILFCTRKMQDREKAEEKGAMMKGLKLTSLTEEQLTNIYSLMPAESFREAMSAMPASPASVAASGRSADALAAKGVAKEPPYARAQAGQRQKPKKVSFSGALDLEHISIAGSSEGSGKETASASEKDNVAEWFECPSPKTMTAALFERRGGSLGSELDFEAAPVKRDSSSSLEVFKKEEDGLAKPKPSEEEASSTQFGVTLRRPDGRLLGVTFDKELAGLVIRSIIPGLVDDWNAEHPDEAIAQWDRIVSVNGVKDDTEEMKAVLKTEEVLELVVARLPKAVIWARTVTKAAEHRRASTADRARRKTLKRVPEDAGMQGA